MLPAGVHAAPMTYTNALGRQFIVVAAGGHKDLGDKVGDYIVAFALPSATRAPFTPAMRIVTGKYAGKMLLDRTGYPATWDLKVGDTATTLTIAAPRINLQASGTGRVRRDTLTIDLKWSIPDRKCGGTMHLTGTAANSGAALIGTVEYFDGCADHRDK